MQRSTIKKLMPRRWITKNARSCHHTRPLLAPSSKALGGQVMFHYNRLETCSVNIQFFQDAQLRLPNVCPALHGRRLIVEKIDFFLKKFLKSWEKKEPPNSCRIRKIFNWKKGFNSEARSRLWFFVRRKKYRNLDLVAMSFHKYQGGYHVILDFTVSAMIPGVRRT
jgi:hypothetical protein